MPTNDVPGPPPNPVPGPAREVFYQEFFRRAQQFATDTMVLVPELESVAIVPVWEVQQDRLPHAMIIGRNGPVSQPQELMHLLLQLQGAMVHVLQRNLQLIRDMDAQMGKIAKAIHDRQRELAQLDPSTPPTAPLDGSAPAGPG